MLSSSSMFAESSAGRCKTWGSSQGQACTAAAARGQAADGKGTTGFGDTRPTLCPCRVVSNKFLKKKAQHTHTVDQTVEW